MVRSLPLLFLSGLFLMGTIVLLRWLEFRTWRRELVTYRLRFPRDIDPKAVTAFLAGLSGLVAPRWQRLTAVRAVVFETGATSKGITHHLILPRSLAAIALSQLRAALPNVAVEEDADYRAVRPKLAGELGLSSAIRPLRTDDPAATSTAILASLQPLEPGETVLLQWVVSPAGPIKPVQPRSHNARNGAAKTLLENVTTQVGTGEELRAARAKQSRPLFQVAGRVGAVAASPARARLVLQRLTAALHGANAPGAHLRRRAVPSGSSSRQLQRRAVPLVRQPCLLNAAELTALVAFPLNGPQVPGLQLGGCRQLAPCFAPRHIG